MPVQPSVRLQTYVVCGVVVACFSIIYPKLFHPMVMGFFGIAKQPSATHGNTANDGSNWTPPPRPGIRPAGHASQTQATAKRGGAMVVVLPMYAVGVAIYLVYTLVKVYRSRKNHKGKCPKDEMLREYYRDFHYDVNRGKFRMGHDGSSSEDNGDACDEFPGARLSTLSDKRSPYTTPDGCFDWAAAYGNIDQPNIYRSAKDLPRDLETLLMRMEREEVSQDELSSLRTRLEKTESEMSRLLRAIDEAETAMLYLPDDAENIQESATASPEYPAGHMTSSDGEYEDPPNN